MEMVRKTINETDVDYQVLAEPGVLVNCHLIVHRKISVEAAKRALKQTHKNNLVRQTVKCSYRKIVREMPVQKFIQFSTLVEPSNGKTVSE